MPNPSRTLLLVATLATGCATHTTDSQFAEVSGDIQLLSEKSPIDRDSQISPDDIEKLFGLEFQGITNCEDDLYSEYLKSNPQIQRKLKTAWIQFGDTSSDLPVEVNRHVLNWIHYFQTKGRRTFAKWMDRGHIFVDDMRSIIESHALPKDLVYLAMIESGFNTKAFSRARAAGPWQFMRATGRKFGLKVNTWVDERRNPVKSTHAAARYLKILYTEFGNWYLALAAYNAGEGKIRRAIRRYKRRTFWELTKYRYLKNETKNFVPKFLAALIISKNPRKFGFKHSPITKKIKTRFLALAHPISLTEFSRKSRIPLKQLYTLNPELRTDITPPQSKRYLLVIPDEMHEVATSVLAQLAKLEIKKTMRHRIRRGETLSGIARQYRVPLRQIWLYNPGIKARRLQIGQRINVPVTIAPLKLARAASGTRRGNNQGIHLVKRGDTLWDIAATHGVPVRSLVLQNNLRSPSHIKPGQVIIIHRQ